jgi:hypothetical protein
VTSSDPRPDMMPAYRRGCFAWQGVVALSVLGVATVVVCFWLGGSAPGWKSVGVVLVGAVVAVLLEVSGRRQHDREVEIRRQIRTNGCVKCQRPFGDGTSINWIVCPSQLQVECKECGAGNWYTMEGERLEGPRTRGPVGSGR